jgi:hypothetical protein
MTNRKGEVPTKRSEHILKGEDDSYICMAGKKLRIGKGSRENFVMLLADLSRCVGRYN